MQKEITNSKSYSYDEYRKLVNELLKESKTTGSDQSEERVEFTKLNNSRMNRLDKTITLTSDLSDILMEMKCEQIWLVLVEAWCGDCAQIVPLFEKIAAASFGKIEHKIILSEENSAIWESVVKTTKHSIPQLIILNRSTSKVIGLWGSRPEPANKIMLKWKANLTTISKQDFELELHIWYANDKTASSQKELLQKINSLELENCESRS